MAKFHFRIAWAYLIEIALAVGAYLFCWAVLGIHDIAVYVGKTADEWNDLTAGLFSAGVAIWLTFVNIQSTDFGDYLRFKKKDGSYTFAFIAPMVVFFMATATLISSKGIASDAFANVAFFLLLYSGAMLFTLIRTATQMVKAYGEFRNLVKHEQAEEEATMTLPMTPPEQSPET